MAVVTAQGGLWGVWLMAVVTAEGGVWLMAVVRLGPGDLWFMAVVTAPGGFWASCSWPS
jgi:hypothetical protein